MQKSMLFISVAWLSFSSVVFSSNQPVNLSEPSGEAVTLAESGCDVWYFRNGTTVCKDKYGWYVKVPNHGTMAYGSNFTRREVWAMEGLSDDDVTRDEGDPNCECTK